MVVSTLAASDIVRVLDGGLKRFEKDLLGRRRQTTQRADGGLDAGQTDIDAVDRVRDDQVDPAGVRRQAEDRQPQVKLADSLSAEGVDQLFEQADGITEGHDAEQENDPPGDLLEQPGQIDPGGWWCADGSSLGSQVGLDKLVGLGAQVCGEGVQPVGDGLRTGRALQADGANLGSELPVVGRCRS
jgi:hypothetical protein